jgi:hypothetical protein
MKAAGGRSTGIRRNWIFPMPTADVAVRLVGEIETRPRPDVRTIETADGPVQIMAPEHVLVEWAFVASLPSADSSGAFALQEMIEAAARMGASFDWGKAYAIAGSEEYRAEAFLRDFVRRAMARAPGASRSES